MQPQQNSNTFATKKPPRPIEESLGYMAWDVKTIGQELHNLNNNLTALINVLDRRSQSKTNHQDDCPF